MTWQRASFSVALAATVTVSAGLAAQPLKIPGSARLTFDNSSVLDSYDMPLGAFENGAVPVETLEGRIDRRVWRLDGSELTTLQIIAPLREQLIATGFKILFECNDVSCGGFDFRFEVEVLPAPDMQVDVRDYRFLSARDEAGTAVSVLVSRNGGVGYVQTVSVSPSQVQAVPASPADAGPARATQASSAGNSVDDLSTRLLTKGHVILDGLVFAPGGSSLEDGTYASLDALARFLADHPDLAVVVVGHTDSTGDLLANIRLSKRRAQAVRTRLIGAFDADPDRIGAEGNGYLSPVASNLTEEGRRANRRVEAILLP